MLHIVTVVGARPQFVKAAALTRRIADFPNLRESVIHTGQHYDHAMSGQFFAELGMPEPVANLEVGSGSHGSQTGMVMSRLEQVLPDLAPDVVLVYGDTNSTLAAALVAAKMGVTLAHVEAGLRSFRRAMPEEVNRVVTDRLADLMFCPSQLAATYLEREGKHAGVHVVGDIMVDSFLHQRAQPEAASACARLGLDPGRFLLATVHRAENTDDPARLASIMAALTRVGADLPVVLPLHPRTRKAAEAAGVSLDGIRILDPLSYGTTVGLTAAAAAVATDSGGLQKEAYFAGTPCVTLRDETEWVETLENGWNRLAPPGDAAPIVAAIQAALCFPRLAPPPPVYGQPDAAGRILSVLAGL